jgi:hypothetical protein
MIQRSFWCKGFTESRRDEGDRVTGCQGDGDSFSLTP